MSQSESSEDRQPCGRSDRQKADGKRRYEPPRLTYAGNLLRLVGKSGTLFDFMTALNDRP